MTGQPRQRVRHLRRGQDLHFFSFNLRRRDCARNVSADNFSGGRARERLVQDPMRVSDSAGRERPLILAARLQ